MNAEGYAIVTLRDGATLARCELHPGLGALWGYPARQTDVVRRFRQAQRGEAAA
jgi:hypothetical protein